MFGEVILSHAVIGLCTTSRSLNSRIPKFDVFVEISIKHRDRRLGTNIAYGSHIAKTFNHDCVPTAIQLLFEMSNPKVGK